MAPPTSSSSLPTSPANLSPTQETIKPPTTRSSRANARYSLTPESFFQSSSTTSSNTSTSRRRSAAAVTEPSPSDRVDCRPLILALEADRREEAIELINLNVGLNSVNDDLSTCEMITARKNNLECLELLLEQRQQHNINTTDLYVWTALMYSCYYGHPEVCKRLLVAGTQSDLYDNDNMNALMWASGRGHTECVSHLIKFGRAKVNQVDKCGTSPLIWACRKGYTEVASLLLKAGANIDCTGMFGLSAILAAVRGDHMECLKLLLQYKPNVNTCDTHRHTPLIDASKEGQLEMVKLLLKARAFVNLSDEYGNSALVHAAKGNHVEVVDLLIKHHANIDHQGEEKKTAIFWATEKGHQQVVERLLQSRPNLELATKEGETCLMKAVKMRKLNLVQLLLNHHAKASTTDRNGDTILHVAIRMQSTQIAQLILSYPKNHHLLNKQNKARQSPLILAQNNATDNFMTKEIYIISNEKKAAHLGHSLESTG